MNRVQGCIEGGQIGREVIDTAMDRVTARERWVIVTRREAVPRSGPTGERLMCHRNYEVSQ